MLKLERLILAALESCRKAKKQEYPKEIPVAVEDIKILAEAAQKQIPQEVSPLLSDDDLPVGWKCPNCGKLVDDYAHYCKYCGQAVCDD